MELKTKLLSNMFLRNMIADLFGRSAHSKTPGGFTPYFQYKIGPYQSDYYLYFPKEPYAFQYKNEAFNKINEFNDADIIYYLEFHYSAYTDKPSFLKFLQYEVYGRLNMKLGASRHRRLLIAQEWVSEKQRELKSQHQEFLKKEIENEVREALPAGTTTKPEHIDNIINNLTRKLADHFDQLISTTGEKMQSLSESFVTGSIELNNQNHLDLVIKLFKLLKDVQAQKQPGKATEQLFKRFSDTDIAAILRLHFADFKSKQPNTIQINIKKADERIRDASPKVKKLEEALQEYFY